MASNQSTVFAAMVWMGAQRWWEWTSGDSEPGPTPRGGPDLQPEGCQL